MSSTACAEAHNPALWYSDDPACQRVAKAICGDCVIRQECLEGALERRELYGIWGGMSFTERKRELGRRYDQTRRVRRH